LPEYSCCLEGALYRNLDDYDDDSSTTLTITTLMTTTNLMIAAD